MNVITYGMYFFDEFFRRIFRRIFLTNFSTNFFDNFFSFFWRIFSIIFFDEFFIFQPLRALESEYLRSCCYEIYLRVKKYVFHKHIAYLCPFKNFLQQPLTPPPPQQQLQQLQQPQPQPPPPPQHQQQPQVNISPILYKLFMR